MAGFDRFVGGCRYARRGSVGRFRLSYHLAEELANRDALQWVVEPLVPIVAMAAVYEESIQLRHGPPISFIEK
jgi:hypothetical protein